MPLTFLGQNKISESARKFEIRELALPYLVKEVLSSGEGKVVSFTLDALKGTASGELGTLFYSSDNNKSGLLFVFFNQKWVPDALFQKYSFLNMSSEKGVKLLNTLTRIEKKWRKNNNILGKRQAERSIFFTVDDLLFVMDHGQGLSLGLNLRVYWGDYNSKWSFSSLSQTKKKLEKILKKQLN
tara:strand:+ start:117 stop:668 length:552 start_codon:yes stop_codon:yes gene_type:complete